MRCTHYACQCARAAELAEIADRTGQGQHLVDAVDLWRWDLEVECRQAPERPDTPGDPR